MESYSRHQFKALEKQQHNFSIISKDLQVSDLISKPLRKNLNSSVWTRILQDVGLEPGLDVDDNFQKQCF